MDFNEFPLNHINLNKSDTKFFKIFNSLYSDFHNIKIEYFEEDYDHYKNILSIFKENCSNKKMLKVLNKFEHNFNIIFNSKIPDAVKTIQEFNNIYCRIRNLDYGNLSFDFDSSNFSKFSNIFELIDNSFEIIQSLKLTYSVSNYYNSIFIDLISNYKSISDITSKTLPALELILNKCMLIFVINCTIRKTEYFIWSILLNRIKLQLENSDHSDISSLDFIKKDFPLSNLLTFSELIKSYNPNLLIYIYIHEYYFNKLKFIKSKSNFKKYGDVLTIFHSELEDYAEYIFNGSPTFYEANQFWKFLINNLILGLHECTIETFVSISYSNLEQEFCISPSIDDGYIFDIIQELINNDYSFTYAIFKIFKYFEVYPIKHIISTLEMKLFGHNFKEFDYLTLYRKAKEQIIKNNLINKLEKENSEILSTLTSELPISEIDKLLEIVKKNNSRIESLGEFLEDFQIHFLELIINVEILNNLINKPSISWFD